MRFPKDMCKSKNQRIGFSAKIVSKIIVNRRFRLLAILTFGAELRAVWPCT